METQTLETPTPVWKTVMWPAVALAISQTAYFVLMDSELFWYVVPLLYIGPIVIPVGAFILMMWTSKPAPPLYALLVLPVVLYASGMLSCILAWWIDGAPSYWFPLSSDIWKPNSLYTLYGPYRVYGVTAAVVWVGCLIHTWKHARTTRRALINNEN